MPGLMGPAGAGGMMRRTSRRTARRTTNRLNNANDAQQDNMAAPAPQAADDSSDAIQKLKDLGALHESGVLTDEEFEVKKAQILKDV